MKKLTKQALKLIPAMLTPLVTPLAGSTRFISNTLIYLCTTSITPKASTVNKYKKLFSPPPLGLFKFSQRAKPIKVTQITYIEPLVNYSQYIKFQNKEAKEVKEVKKVILYQVLEGYGCCRHYYNKTEEEVKARKEHRRDELYARQEHNIKKLKGLNLKVLLNLKMLNLGLYNLDFIN